MNRVTLNEHIDHWQFCSLCPLCETRKRTVLFRRLKNDRIKTQKLNCDILFIGEGPGGIEDMKGKPFIGPAGRLLVKIIRNALNEWIDPSGLDWKPIVGFTNIVACHPPGKDAENRPPTKKEAEACRNRLKECIHNSCPKVLVCVGTVAKAMLPGANSITKVKKLYPSVEQIGFIIHPSHILRKSSESQSHEVAKCTLDVLRIIKQSF